MFIEPNFGQWHAVKAEIIQTGSLSAHGDQNDIIKWLGQFDEKALKVFINKGKPIASHTLKLNIEDEFQLPVQITEMTLITRSKIKKAQLTTGLFRIQ